MKVIKDALDTTFELSKLLKYSSKRKATFKAIKEQLAPSDPGFRTLCPTRWTVRADSLASVVANYSVLQTSLESFVELSSRDMEMSARVNGIGSQLERFDFLFGVMLGEKFLRLADNLSRTLQQKDLSAAEGNHAAQLTCATLTSLRKHSEFAIFWSEVVKKQSEFDVDDPVLPRRRKAPARFEVGTGESHHPSSIEDHYRVQFFEALDLLIACIKDRFDQPGYRVYSKLETLLIDAANGVALNEVCFSEMMDLYASDFDRTLLKSQLLILQTNFSDAPKPVRFSSIQEFLIGLSQSQSLLSEVVKLMKLVLVMPATNATSERSFSALKRVKTYLRSSMKQSRLNHLMILHVHKEMTDSLNLTDCANDFAGSNEHRFRIFGKFT